jgi:hypothetical protein
MLRDLETPYIDDRASASRHGMRSADLDDWAKRTRN